MDIITHIEKYLSCELDIVNQFIASHKNNSIDLWEPLHITDPTIKRIIIFHGIYSGYYGETSEIPQDVLSITIDKTKSINGKNFDFLIKL